MRAIYKTGLYRIITFVLTFVATWAFTQELLFPTFLSLFHEGIHTAIYYLFEKKIKSD